MAVVLDVVLVGFVGVGQFYEVRVPFPTLVIETAVCPLDLALILSEGVLDAQQHEFILYGFRGSAEVDLGFAPDVFLDFEDFPHGEGTESSLGAPQSLLVAPLHLVELVHETNQFFHFLLPQFIDAFTPLPSRFLLLLGHVDSLLAE